MGDRELSQEEAQYARTLLEAASKYQLVVYKLFNWVAMTLLVTITIGGLGIVLGQFLNWELGEQISCVAAFVVAGLSLLLMPIFLVNLPRLLEFWRLAGFRRDLGLGAALTSTFQHEGEKMRLRHLLTGLGVLIGLGLVIYSVVLFFGEHWSAREYGMFGLEELLLLAMPFMIGLSFLALHFVRRFVRRAGERLSVATGILDTLGAGDTEGALTNVSLSAGVYETVAKLERESILLERQESIRVASRKTDVSRFALQRSREVQSVLGKLDHDARHAAERKVFSLMENPTPPESSVDQETGLLVLPIDESGWELLYDIDEDLKRVRIHMMRESGTDE